MNQSETEQMVYILNILTHNVDWSLWGHSRYFPGHMLLHTHWRERTFFLQPLWEHVEKTSFHQIFQEERENSDIPKGCG